MPTIWAVLFILCSIIVPLSALADAIVRALLNWDAHKTRKALAMEQTQEFDDSKTQVTYSSKNESYTKPPRY